MDKIQDDLALVALDAARNNLQRRMNELFHVVSKQGFHAWAHLANCLFYAVARHEGADAARRIFDESGPPPAELITKLKDQTLLDRLHAMPKPNMRELARQIVKENGKLPKEKQRGAGGTNLQVMWDRIRKLEADHKKRQAKWERSLKR